MNVRILPGTSRELGLVNALVTQVLGRVGGTPAPNLFTTLGKHRGLFRRWLWFASGLMPGGQLPRAETELLILRVAHACDSAYEWQHHERIARRAGLTADEIERVRRGPTALGWSARQQTLLQAADELHQDRRIGDVTWAKLRAFYGERELIELCMLVGHYEMLAMTLNSLGVALDTPRED